MIDWIKQKKQIFKIPLTEVNLIKHNLYDFFNILLILKEYEIVPEEVYIESIEIRLKTFIILLGYSSFLKYDELIPMTEIGNRELTRLKIAMLQLFVGKIIEKLHLDLGIRN